MWDNEGGVGRFRGQGRPPALSAQFAELRGLLGCEVVVLPPREPICIRATTLAKPIWAL